MNRQVPKRYCLIGDGKVARHMAHYLDLLGISYTRWYRSNKRTPLQKIKQLFVTENAALKQALKSCDHVLLLISDDQIEPFIEKHAELQGHDLIHFSGALTTPLAKFCHPLTTFNQDKYTLDTYQKIPFIHAAEFDFEATFPELSNAHHVMQESQQSLYHAYCVMAGNFSQMMWLTLGKKMKDLGLPENIMHSYIEQNTENFITSPEKAATGPLSRGDIKTIEKHLNALKGDGLENIYRAFLQWHNADSNNADEHNEHKVAS